MLGQDLKIIVWAHNSHVGDATATPMGGMNFERNEPFDCTGVHWAFPGCARILAAKEVEPWPAAFAALAVTSEPVLRPPAMKQPPLW